MKISKSSWGSEITLEELEAEDEKDIRREAEKQYIQHRKGHPLVEEKANLTRLYHLTLSLTARVRSLLEDMEDGPIVVDCFEEHALTVIRTAKMSLNENMISGEIPLTNILAWSQLLRIQILERLESEVSRSRIEDIFVSFFKDLTSNPLGHDK